VLLVAAGDVVPVDGAMKRTAARLTIGTAG
jgi:hypothetical protein